MIANTLVQSDCGNPLFLIDEIDKAISYRDEKPADALHALLEPENSRSFRDQFLEFPIRADQALRILTANEMSGLKNSLLDRLLILRVDRPTGHHLRAVLTSIVRAAIAPYSGLVRGDLNDLAFARLSALPPRRAKRAIESAIGYAVAACRRTVLAADIEAAAKLVTSKGISRTSDFHQGK